MLITRWTPEQKVTWLVEAENNAGALSVFEDHYRKMTSNLRLKTLRANDGSSWGLGSNHM